MAILAALADALRGQSEWEHRDTFPPGPQLAVVLTGDPLGAASDTFRRDTDFDTSRDECEGFTADAELLAVARAARRQMSWAASRQLAMLAALAKRRRAEAAAWTQIPSYRRVGVEESLIEEISLELGITSNAAAILLRMAERLAERLADDLPRMRRLLESGQISVDHVRILCDALVGLPTALIPLLEAAVAPDAPNMTTGQFRKRVKAVLQALDPDGFTERSRTTTQQHRRLVPWDNGDGTADLTLCDMPAEQISAIYNKITAVAQAMRADGDIRSLDQLRADLATALLQGTTLPNAARALLTPAPDTEAPNPPQASTPAQAPSPTSETSGTTANREASGTSASCAVGKTTGTGTQTSEPAATNTRASSGSAASAAATATTASDSVQATNPPSGSGHAEAIPAVSGASQTPTTATTASGVHNGSAAASIGVSSDGIGTGDIFGPVRVTSPAFATGMGEAAAKSTGGAYGAVSDAEDAPGVSLRGIASVTAADPVQALDVQMAQVLAQIVDRQLAAVLERAGATGRMDRLAVLTSRAVQRIDLALSGLRDSWCRATGPTPERHGHPGYKPPAAMQRLIEQRHPRCVFPTCGQPVERCDVDHTRPHDKGGPTCRCNLAPLCRRHHRTKQTRGWKLFQLWPGLLIWITPNGQWHIVTPHPRP